ncbi:cache domain-containing protein, partial [Bradyrhizobium sp.]|uniref:cache domain-containing protein n=1 Tax=Bradyrhizobium sp. TaxID=376 RepID=UPI002736367B
MSEAGAGDSVNESTLRSSPAGVRAKYHAARVPILWVTVVCTAFAIGLIAAASVTVVATRNKTLSDGTGDLSRLGLAIATHTHKIIFGADLIISDLEERFISAGKVSADGFVEYAGIKSMNGLLHDMVVISSDLDTLVMIDRHGKLINSSLSGPTPAIDLSDRDYFINLRDNPDLSYFISEPLKNRGTGQDSIFLAHRINGSDGAFVGIILGSIATSRFAKLFSPMLPSSEASISLYRRDGTLLSRQPQLESPGEKSQAIQQVFANAIAGTEQETLRTRALGGTPQIVAIHTVPGYPLVVVAADSEDVILASWRQLALLISAVTAGAIVLLAIGGYQIGRQFRMQTQIEEARAHQEKSDRARAIAQTAERIQAKARDELKAIMDHASDGLISIESNGTIRNFSKPAENIFGYRADEVIGHDVNMLLTEPRDQRSGSGLAMAT